MSQTPEFIARLTSDRLFGPGERARLRALAGRGLDADVPGFDIFTGLWWPLRQKSPRAPERATAWMVAKLFGAFPIPPDRHERAELARVLGQWERSLRNEFDRKRFRSRFDALLQSPLSALEPHLRWALSVVRKAVGQKQINGLDWVRLLDDLRLWIRGPDKQDENPDRRERDVRDVWAGQYLNVTK